MEAFLEALMLLVSGPESHRRSLPLHYSKLFLGRWYSEYMERSKKVYLNITFECSYKFIVETNSDIDREVK